MLAQKPVAMSREVNVAEVKETRKKPSKLLQLRGKASAAFLEHIYKTEDTLFQIAYDKRFRPKIYKLCTEEVREDALQRYESLCNEYKQNQQKDVS